jgi:asparagine synthetase B (glutamine-hydrolysing)
MSAIYGAAGESCRERQIDISLDAMAAALRRRGPDDEARWVGTTEPAALGFRFLRAAIGERSPGVIFNEDRSLMMVCDGHVFNAGALRSYLRDRGHSVAHAHSCELLLHLYEEEGISGWRRADGQFALAIWDAHARRLVLGRDFLGVRPLYYWSRPDGIVFARLPRRRRNGAGGLSDVHERSRPENAVSKHQQASGGLRRDLRVRRHGPRRTVLGSAPESHS